MPTIYATLPFKEPKPITVEARTGQALSQAIRDGLAELKDKEVTAVSFEGYADGELSEAFYAKHSTPPEALLVRYSINISHIISSSSEAKTFTCEGYMVELAERLKVNPKLYVRECYEELWTIYIDYEKERRELQNRYPHFIPHVYLTGTPGIGKTGFLLYFIHRLLQDKRQVIFGSKSIRVFIYWKSIEDYSVISEGAVEPYLTNRDVFFVMDSRDIESTLGPCVICSSPRDDIAKQFRKTAKALYMPVWE
ncbi:hypothetical protein MP638_002741 [Amoeboaphelidium occidentale]|nr:hypothetical protein MP638_002741 [Amoeboaphelidium occidentale]